MAKIKILKRWELSELLRGEATRYKSAKAFAKEMGVTYATYNGWVNRMYDSMRVYNAESLWAYFGKRLRGYIQPLRSWENREIPFKTKLTVKPQLSKEIREYIEAHYLAKVDYKDPTFMVQKIEMSVRDDMAFLAEMVEKLDKGIDQCKADDRITNERITLLKKKIYALEEKVFEQKKKNKWYEFWK